MPISTIILYLGWFVLMLSASMIAIVILSRRGSAGLPYFLLVVIGAGGASLLFVSQVGPVTPPGYGLGGIVLFLLGCIGLHVPKRPKTECWNCGYDLAHMTSENSACCPECGTLRPEMEGHCRQCKADVRQALAAGSIVCPGCHAKIAEPRGM